MPIRMIKKTSTAIVTSDFNLSRPGEDLEVDVLYILTEVVISSDGSGIAKFALSIDGTMEGIKQSFPFKIDSGGLFSEIEEQIFSLPEFAEGKLIS